MSWMPSAGGADTPTGLYTNDTRVELERFFDEVERILQESPVDRRVRSMKENHDKRDLSSVDIIG